MLSELMQQFNTQLQTFFLLLSLLNGILHLIFAGAVAKDAGKLLQLGQKPALVSGTIWAFATLIGGIIVATIYWFIHHSNLTKPLGRNQEKFYESN